MLSVWGSGFKVEYLRFGVLGPPEERFSKCSTTTS